jgi:DNA-binding FadR family transcriptional regulator
MTRQPTQPASVVPPKQRKHPLLEPIGAHRNLTGEVVERIADGIRCGLLSPGERLPTEQELMLALGVSRTVVREAVAALKAEGLVITRQGAGAFVAADGSRVPFRLEPEGMRSIEDVLAVMELRIAIEVEAAGLAAARATSDEIAAIMKAHANVDAAILRGENAVLEDFAFHRVIAAATGNRHYAQFLAFLGRHVIPRQSVRAQNTSPAVMLAYLTRIQREHTRIAHAVSAHDVSGARRAMRKHLTNSLDRYRRMAETLARQPG